MPVPASPQPVPLKFAPGIQRDGTPFDSDRVLDAQWVRWRNGAPRSMLGYIEIVNNLSGIPRRIHMFYTGGQTIIHIGTSTSLLQVVIDQNANVVSQSDRTPTTFAAGIEVGWTFDAIFDVASKQVQLLAHAAPDLEFSASTTKSIPFLGQINSTTRLQQFSEPSNLQGGTYAAPSVSGGVFCVQPFVFDFDSDGFVGWSAPNEPNYLGVTAGTSGAGDARISAQKIVAGMALRGGGAQSPAALFWSLSELISAVYVGQENGTWAFNTVSPSSSIISTDAVIEYDGLYFWCGIDRFLVYNGTVVEVPNSQNLDWFFTNMNWAYSAKTYAFKVPRAGEIWFCAPLFGNTEPSHAAIYNVRENYWYDTVLPNGGRSCAFYAQGFRNPMMCGSTRGPNGYSLWMHETGTDQVSSTGTPAPILKYWETPYIGGPKNTPATNSSLQVAYYEPDFIQTGDMKAWPLMRTNVRAPESAGPSVAIPLIPQVPQEEAPPFNQTSRLLRIHTESNVLGGSFISGRILAHLAPVDEKRVTS